MAELMRQEPDGRWVPAQEVGWQGHGLDWEVKRTERGYTAELFQRAALVATARARYRLTLAVKMRLAQRRARR